MNDHPTNTSAPKGQYTTARVTIGWLRRKALSMWIGGTKRNPDLISRDAAIAICEKSVAQRIIEGAFCLSGLDTAIEIKEELLSMEAVDGKSIEKDPM